MNTSTLPRPQIITLDHSHSYKTQSEKWVTMLSKTSEEDGIESNVNLAANYSGIEMGVHATESKIKSEENLFDWLRNELQHKAESSIKSWEQVSDYKEIGSESMVCSIISFDRTVVEGKKRTTYSIETTLVWESGKLSRSQSTLLSYREVIHN